MVYILSCCLLEEDNNSSINILVSLILQIIHMQNVWMHFFHTITAAAISGSTSHMIFSESPAAPGIPLVYRTPEDKASNPERLNLDR